MKPAVLLHAGPPPALNAEDRVDMALYEAGKPLRLCQIAAGARLGYADTVRALREGLAAGRYRTTDQGRRVEWRPEPPESGRRE